MLHFFARRLNELHKEDRKGEKGFTLIELLVVVIIIGILAAIAIPVFLAQRTQAWEAAAKSDLRNAAAAATSCSADKGGTYAGCATAAELKPYGFRQTENVTYNNVAATATRWAASAKHNSGGDTFGFDTAAEGRVVVGAPS